MHPLRSTMCSIAKILLLACFPSNAFSVDKPPTVPQVPKGTGVTVVRSNGFVLEGRLLSFNDREVRIQTRTKSMTLQAKDIREIRTQDDTLTWDAGKKTFRSAKSAEDARSRAEADRAAEKLKGSWVGYLYHLPKGFEVGLDRLPLRPDSSICVLEVESGDGKRATGRMSLPGLGHSCQVTIQAKPLTERSRKLFGGTGNEAHFDVDIACDPPLPLPGHDLALAKFALGGVWTNRNEDGIYPLGGMLSAESISYADAAGTESAKSKRSYASLALAKQPRPTGLIRRTTPLTLRDSRVTLGPGAWIRFQAEIRNSGTTDLDAKIVCVVEVDNETVIFNRPHQFVFDIRVPAGKTVPVDETRGFINTLNNVASKSGGVGLLYKLLETTWVHIPNGRAASVAIVSVSCPSSSGAAKLNGGTKPFAPIGATTQFKSIVPPPSNEPYWEKKFGPCTNCGGDGEVWWILNLAGDTCPACKGRGFREELRPRK